MKTRDRRLISLFVGLLILTLSACAPSDGALSDTGDNQQPGSETGLANTRWRLVSYGEPGSETQITSTEIACTAEGVMEQEQQYFQTLQNAGEFELTNGQLTIRYGDRQGVLNFVPMESS